MPSGHLLTVQPGPSTTAIEVVSDGFAPVWQHVRPGSKALIFCGEGVRHLLPEVLGAAPAESVVLGPVILPEGEAAKTVDVLAQGWDTCGRLGIGRGDVLIAVGGGSTTDVVGFIAATWMRGIPVIHVPTTVLAMVDGAIGGKTAVNSPAGKNMIGAFHAPVAVVCSLATLRTLPERDRRAGMAEVIKAGWIRDASILVDMEKLTPQTPYDDPAMVDVMRKAVAVKAEVVGEDFHEHGARMLLNYGHTFGHAVEKASQFEMRHGEAVAVGMMFAAHVGVASGLLSEADARRHADILCRWQLPVASERQWPWKELWRLMTSDKKNRGSGVRFILSLGPGTAQICDDISESVMVAAARSVNAVCD